MTHGMPVEFSTEEEIQKGIEAHEVDEKPSQLAFHIVRMAWKEAGFPKPVKIPESIGLVHNQEIHRHLFLLNCADYFHFNSFRHKREPCQVHPIPRTIKGYRGRLLHELRALLRQLVQSVVCFHCRNILHIEACRQFGDNINACCRRKLQEAYASLYDFGGVDFHHDILSWRIRHTQRHNNKAEF